jgi:hypothetical protein
MMTNARCWDEGTPAFYSNASKQEMSRVHSLQPVRLKDNASIQELAFSLIFLTSPNPVFSHGGACGFFFKTWTMQPA